MVSSIGFGTTTPQTTSFQDLINKPQAYKQPIQAATTIYGQKEESKALKVIKKLAITTGIVIVGLITTNKMQGKILGLIEKIGNDNIKTKLTTATNAISNLGGAVDGHIKKRYTQGKNIAKEIPSKAQDAYNWCKVQVEKLIKPAVENGAGQVPQ